MEVDSPHSMNGSINGNQDGDFNIFPVSNNVGGEGLPYAPINWPNPGDNWSWRTGKRLAASGHHLDRYLYPPKRLRTSKRNRYGFSSKQSVEKFVSSEFPNTDVKAFFDSFIWRIPSSQATVSKDDSADVPPFCEAIRSSSSNSQEGDPVCKAGNKACSSLVGDNSSSKVMSCDLCCEEPGFCRDCCCILCCQTISSARGGYSYFRCKALVKKNTICGHIAHINCGLRAYLAGTVGGSIGLDAEYYCRRCDARSDLFPHVSKLLQTCKSIGSREQIEEILGVGVCILSGSQRRNAKQLLRNISLAVSKLKKGADLEDVWKFESSPTDTAAGGQPSKFSSSCDNPGKSLALEDEIEQTLLELKNSQESEYKVAAETLIAQKKYIQNLYQRLDHEKSHLSRHVSKANAEALLQTVLGQMEQVKGEVAKFNDMKKVSKGFGRTPKPILKEHFGMETED